MKLHNSVLALGLALTSIANASTTSHTLGMLGNLIRTNAEGDYHYTGDTNFAHNGSRAYVDHFVNLLATNSTDRASYHDVMMQGINSWEDENKSKGFTSDIAGSLAFFTVTNMALAKNRDFKDNLFPNLVSQFRKALAASSVASLSTAKKQDIYDYTLAESVYVRILASAGRDQNAINAAKTITDTTTYHIKETFGADPSLLTITETGLRFK